MSSSATAASRVEFLRSRGAVIDVTASVVADFGDPEAERTAFSTSAALLDRSTSACLLQQGADALDLLHRLTTNDLLSLQPGDSRFTVLTSERGRIIDVVQVAAIETDRLFLLSESPDPQPTIDWIEKFTIIEDSEVRDVAGEMSRLAVIGPYASSVVKAAFDVDVEPGKVTRVAGGGGETLLVASGWADVERVDVVAPAERFEATWELLVDAGAVPAGHNAFEAFRIENGIPLACAELNEDSNPLEASLKHLISFTKGCYVGQEVVARLDTYDKLQRRLVRFETDTELAVGAELESGGKRAGRVTSVSALPEDGTFTALGYARKGSWDDGTVLEHPGGTFTVRELGETLPFS